MKRIGGFTIVATAVAVLAVLGVVVLCAQSQDKDKYRDLEAEFPGAAAHAIHGGVVFARVTGVENEFVNWPVLDALRHRLTGHASPHQEFSLY